MNAIVRAPDRRLAWDVISDFDNLVNHFVRPARESANDGHSLVPTVDISETDGAYIVKAELPGVKKEDLDVSIKDGLLSINAESRFEHKEETDGRLIRQERRYGKFVRSMRLGGDVDEAKVTAEYNDGILVLTLPKTEEVKPKKIEVQVQ